jgi:hypothetical protein
MLFGKTSERKLTSYWLNKILYKIKRDVAYRELFRTDFSKAVEGFELDEDEVDALRNYNYAKLNRLGAKAMLLLPFAGVTKPGELFTVKSADEKREIATASR